MMCENIRFPNTLNVTKTDIPMWKVRVRTLVLTQIREFGLLDSLKSLKYKQTDWVCKF